MQHKWGLRGLQSAQTKRTRNVPPLPAWCKVLAQQTELNEDLLPNFSLFDQGGEMQTLCQDQIDTLKEEKISIEDNNSTAKVLEKGCSPRKCAPQLCCFNKRKYLFPESGQGLGEQRISGLKEQFRKREHRVCGRLSERGRGRSGRIEYMVHRKTESSVRTISQELVSLLHKWKNSSDQEQ